MNRLTASTLSVAAGVAAALAFTPGAAAAAGAGGVTGPAFYVDGSLYRTVLTPNDLSGTGAPGHSFDTIYEFGGEQMNVATAAPGDRDYNGGRWMVRAVQFPNGYDAAVASGDADGDGVLDSDAELFQAVTAGDAAIGDVVASFTCPVIPL